MAAVTDPENNVEMEDGDEDFVPKKRKRKHSEDGDFVPKERKKKQSEMISLSVSRRKLFKETAVTDKRHKIGISAQRELLANIINVGGGDVEKFSLSNKTVRNAGTSAVKESAEDIKEKFKRMCKDEHEGEKFLIAHFDGKSLAQFHDKVKSVKKRISVIVSSPYLDSDQSQPPTLARIRSRWWLDSCRSGTSCLFS